MHFNNIKFYFCQLLISISACQLLICQKVILKDSDRRAVQKKILFWRFHAQHNAQNVANNLPNFQSRARFAVCQLEWCLSCSERSEFCD